MASLLPPPTSPSVPERIYKVVTVAGGNLYALAAQQLGDATQWNRIAALNGLFDPMITGVMTLRIPPIDTVAGTGGVLGIGYLNPPPFIAPPVAPLPANLQLTPNPLAPFLITEITPYPWLKSDVGGVYIHA
jgi:hypothetical protein